jgi:hypothetical protein
MFSFFIISIVPAVNTNIGLTLGRVNLVTREGTNLEPDVNIISFLHGWIDGWMDGWMMIFTSL